MIYAGLVLVFWVIAQILGNSDAVWGRNGFALGMARVPFVLSVIAPSRMPAFYFLLFLLTVLLMGGYLERSLGWRPILMLLGASTILIQLGYLLGWVRFLFVCSILLALCFVAAALGLAVLHYPTARWRAGTMAVCGGLWLEEWSFGIHNTGVDFSVWLGLCLFLGISLTLLIIHRHRVSIRTIIGQLPIVTIGYVLILWCLFAIEVCLNHGVGRSGIIGWDTFHKLGLSEFLDTPDNFFWMVLLGPWFHVSVPHLFTNTSGILLTGAVVEKIFGKRLAALIIIVIGWAAILPRALFIFELPGGELNVGLEPGASGVLYGLATIGLLFAWGAENVSVGLKWLYYAYAYALIWQMVDQFITFGFMSPASSIADDIHLYGACAGLTVGLLVFSWYHWIKHQKLPGFRVAAARTAH